MFVLATFVAFTAYSFGGFQGEAFGTVAFGAVADFLAFPLQPVLTSATRIH
jgi:hypothetical protein